MKSKEFIHRRRGAERKFLSFSDYLTIFASATEEVKQEQYEAIKSLSRPEFICGVETPQNLNLVTYGQLDDLHDSPEGLGAIVNCVKIVLGVEEGDVMRERADRVLGFASFCNREVDSINKRFASIRPAFDAEEKMAGIESLKFGSFGVLDWYARRMGITDQNEVRSVPWVRIWQCMKNDNEQGKYEKRLREVYKRKNQNRKR